MTMNLRVTCQRWISISDGDLCRSTVKICYAALLERIHDAFIFHCKISIGNSVNDLSSGYGCWWLPPHTRAHTQSTWGGTLAWGMRWVRGLLTHDQETSTRYRKLHSALWSRGFLWTWQWNFVSHKSWVIPGVNGDLFASEVKLCSAELLIYSLQNV
jgi:hypothetical protein